MMQGNVSEEGNCGTFWVSDWWALKNPFVVHQGLTVYMGGKANDCSQ